MPICSRAALAECCMNETWDIRILLFEVDAFDFVTTCHCLLSTQYMCIQICT